MWDLGKTLSITGVYISTLSVPRPVGVGLGTAPHVIIVLLNAAIAFYRSRVFKLGLTSSTGFHQRAVWEDPGKSAGLSSPRSALDITGIFVGTLHGLHTQKLY